MHVRRHANSIEVLAPAKVNLFLEVLARRPDGYHEIETLMGRVSVYDSLFFESTEHDEISLQYRWAAGWPVAGPFGRSGRKSARELHLDELPRGPDNLVWRATALIKARAGARQGARICLIKRIPAAAGLGGASSDAAAALVAADAAWKLGWPRERLVELARELGSDVPFFLAKAVGIGRGRGERIEEATTSRLNMVIVKPPVGLSTPQVYQACRPATEPLSVRRLADSLRRGQAAEVGRAVFNRLQPASEQLTPWIARVATEFSRQPLLGHQMSGSGSSYFGICRSRRQARRVAAALRGRGLGMTMAGAFGDG